MTVRSCTKAALFKVEKISTLPVRAVVKANEGNAALEVVGIILNGLFPFELAHQPTTFSATLLISRTICAANKGTVECDGEEEEKKAVLAIVFSAIASSIGVIVWLTAMVLATLVLAVIGSIFPIPASTLCPIWISITLGTALIACVAPILIPLLIAALTVPMEPIIKYCEMYCDKDSSILVETILGVLLVIPAPLAISKASTVVAKKIISAVKKANLYVHRHTDSDHHTAEHEKKVMDTTTTTYESLGTMKADSEKSFSGKIAPKSYAKIENKPDAIEDFTSTSVGCVDGNNQRESAPQVDHCISTPTLT